MSEPPEHGDDKQPIAQDVFAGRLPLPPSEKSFHEYVTTEWRAILSSWRMGWAADERLNELEERIELTRIRIFEKGQDDRLFDWQTDWVRAHILHRSNLDFVRNRKKYIDDLKQMWSEWESRGQTHISGVSLEALRSMILVNGAAIISALAVLLGQIANPPAMVIVVAKITVLTSVVSIILLASGHALMVEAVGDANARVRGVMVGHARHARLFALNRYIHRYLQPKLKFATKLIYGSIITFALSSLISAVLLFSV